MSLAPRTLLHGLKQLGTLLENRGLRYDLVVIGASAMVLGGVLSRPTEDVDVVGLWLGGKVVPRKPFPPDLQECVEDVGRALSLPLSATHGKDWLNPGPAIALDMEDLDEPLD